MARKTTPRSTVPAKFITKAEAAGMVPAHSLRLVEKGYTVCLNNGGTLSKRKVGAAMRFVVTG